MRVPWFPLRMRASFLDSSPDGRYVSRFSFGQSGGDLSVWDNLTGESIDGFGNSNNVSNAITFSPDSKFVAGPSLAGGVSI